MAVLIFPQDAADSAKVQVDGRVDGGVDQSGPIDAKSHVDVGLREDATHELALDGHGARLDGDDTSGVRTVSTVVVLPDTQYYAAAFPDIFTAQTNWIVEQSKRRNIQAVLHLGDIVDSDTSDQWTRASSAMRILDGVVPYLLVPGNHDMGSDLNLRKSLIDNYFAPQTLPWIMGTFETGKIENNFALVDIGPRKYVLIGLEWGPRNAALAWADGVLKSYAAYPAIVVTHAYLDGDARYDWAKYPGNDGQYWNPHWYAELYSPVAEVNDGEEIYQKLILPLLIERTSCPSVFTGMSTGWSRRSWPVTQGASG